MTVIDDTLVIGAGQAGLAAAYHLQRAGLRVTILDSAQRPGGSWPHYYQSLRLFSPARFSSLPGLPFPGSGERYPARDEVIAYFRSYADHFQFPLALGSPVTAVTHNADGFDVATADTHTYHARSMIAATGAFHLPYLPTIAGQEIFGGTRLHTFGYQDPTPFAGQRVVVVGAGNSAVQIAAELATVAQVTLATRRPVQFVNQRPLGRDVHWWWSQLRLDTSAFESLPGALFRRLVGDRGPVVLDTGVYQAALARQAPAQRAMLVRFTEGGVVWADGTEEAVDAVIFATGYRPNLDYLAPLGALDADGQARHRHGVSLTVPGLGFVGLSKQRTFASATVRGVGADAAVVIRALMQHLQSRTADVDMHRWSLACCVART